MDEFTIKHDIKGFHIFLDITGDYMFTTDTKIKADKIIQALEKQLPKKPLNQRYINKELIGVCPSCRLQWDVAFYERHCSNCGQKLDWSDKDAF